MPGGVGRERRRHRRVGRVGEGREEGRADAGELRDSCGRAGRDNRLDGCQPARLASLMAPQSGDDGGRQPTSAMQRRHVRRQAGAGDGSQTDGPRVGTRNTRSSRMETRTHERLKRISQVAHGETSVASVGASANNGSAEFSMELIRVYVANNDFTKWTCHHQTKTGPPTFVLDIVPRRQTISL